MPETGGSQIHKPILTGTANTPGTKSAITLQFCRSRKGDDLGASLETGTSFAHYRILGPLGAGGMGEVYKAFDTTLERPVAIKILPPVLVKNEERLRRFVQEARAASSLNHPHIVTIHEIGETELVAENASSTQKIHYIAMELVDGVTLRRRIYSDQHDLRVTLGYFAQAADGLAKAHAAGIVHRDLKPENVMVSADGFAKVLDFGLAKLTAQMGPTSSGASSTAIWNEATREGVIMGTVAYMSPEQVQGRTIDHRSDIFSFGAMLYEAATLRRPFSADSDIDLMHAILHDKPQPVDEINPEVPSELRRVIRRCLAKDPEKRYQSMKDLAIELREIVDEWDELSAASRSSSSVSATAPASPLSSRRTGLTLAAAVIIAIAAVAFGAWTLKRNDSSAASPAFASLQIKRLIADASIHSAAISPDGRYVAFVARDAAGTYRVVIRQVATGSDIEIVPAGGITNGVTFSPDGNHVYYSRAEDPVTGPRYYSLYQVPTLGGPPRKVLHDVDTEISFSPDGGEFVFGRGRPQDRENDYVIASADGSRQRVLLTEPAFDPVDAPSWSPDGKSVAVSLRLPPVGAETAVTVVDAMTGQKREIGRKWWDVTEMQWTPAGDSLILAAAPPGFIRTQVWRQPLDGSAASRITNDFNDYDALSLTDDGQSLLALASRYSGTVHIGTIEEPDGGSVVSPLASSLIFQVDACPAGIVAVEILGDDGINVGLYDIASGSLHRLTSDGRSYMPSITADGRTVAFGSERTGTMHVYVMSADGSNVRQLTKGDAAIFPQISPDGATVIYQSDLSMWKIPSSGGSPVEISPRPLFQAMAVSPDSRYAGGQFYKTTVEGTVSVFRGIPLVHGVPPLEIHIPSTPTFAWSPDGEAVHVTHLRNGVDNIYEYPINGGEPRQLSSYTEEEIHSFDWLPDGRLVSSRGKGSSDIVLLTGF